MSNSETLANFIKAFNALKCGYHACPNNRGGVDIVVNSDGILMASLLPRQSIWAIEKSTFSYKELLLMANLSAALLGLRGGNDSGDLEVKEADPLENWYKGHDLAGKMFLGSDYSEIIVMDKTADVFSKLLDMGLDPEDLEAAINEVNNAD